MGFHLFPSHHHRILAESCSNIRSNLLSSSDFYVLIKKSAVCAGMPRCSVFLTWCTGKLFTPQSSYISSMLRNHMACLLIIINVISQKHLNIIKEKLYKAAPSRSLCGVPMNACTFFIQFLSVIFILSVCTRCLYSGIRI